MRIVQQNENSLKMWSLDVHYFFFFKPSFVYSNLHHDQELKDLLDQRENGSEHHRDWENDKNIYSPTF